MDIVNEDRASKIIDDTTYTIASIGANGGGARLVMHMRRVTAATAAGTNVFGMLVPHYRVYIRLGDEKFDDHTTYNSNQLGEATEHFNRCASRVVNNHNFG